MQYSLPIKGIVTVYTSHHAHLYKRFRTYSLIGKKLLAKCRLLQEENEEFGHQLSEGRIHNLENELALQRELTEELKKSLSGALCT
jgi:hypothetical protein